jgi:hypothetical protein
VNAFTQILNKKEFTSFIKVLVELIETAVYNDEQVHYISYSTG